MEQDPVVKVREPVEGLDTAQVTTLRDLQKELLEAVEASEEAVASEDVLRETGQGEQHLQDRQLRGK